MILEQAEAIFQRVLDPMPLDTFLDDILGKRFIKLEGPLQDNRRAGLMGPEPGRVLLDGFAHIAPKITCHAAAPLGPPPAVGPAADAAAFEAKIAAFHALGYTVRLPEIRALAPELDEFLRAMELVFHQPVTAEVFWSRGDARAPIHHDDYDIIVIQLKGRKRWFISTDVSALPNAWKNVPDAPPRLDRFAEVGVEPGDLLYLPRGTTHRVDALSDSLHVSIGFVPLTLREAIIACLDHFSDIDRPLRETVGTRAGAQIAASDFGDLPARVREGLARFSTRCEADAFIAEAMQRRASHVIGDLGKLATQTARVALAPYTRLRHSRLGVCHLSGNAAKIDFAYPGGHHYIHRGVEQAVSFIARTPDFRLRDIPGSIGDDIRVALVEKFVASGFLEVAED